MIEFINALSLTTSGRLRGSYSCYAWMGGWVKNGNRAQCELSEADLVKIIADAEAALEWLREGKF